MTTFATWAEVLRIAKSSTVIAAIVDTDEQQEFLDQAAELWNEDTYTDAQAKRLQIYGAAHFAHQSDTDAGGSGPFSSSSIGGISTSRTLPVLNTDETYGETIYGRILKKYLRQFAPINLLSVNAFETV